MSSCISGGGRAYGLDLDIVKSTSTCSIISHSSSSPSSTLSESSNSPIAISTRKPRTPRKRPNQTYNEAAALLSTACPNIFSTKNLTKVSKFTKNHHHHHSYFFEEPPELLLPFRVIENLGFLLHQPMLENPSFRIASKLANSFEKQCNSPMAIDFRKNCENSNSLDLCDDFDTESMLDEEMGEGIDSIMGNLCVENDSHIDKGNNNNNIVINNNNTCYGYPMGLGFNYDFGFGIRSGVRALRNVDEGNWWSFPTVDVVNINPKAKRVSSMEKKKKKIEKFPAPAPAPEELNRTESGQGNSVFGGAENSNPGKPSSRLLLKLNYDNVLNAWSDKGSPFPEEISGSESPGENDNIHARLAQIDLFSEHGGLREASVIRYKEKKRTRLFSKKIRYQVRKVNADRRPRMKGRFVRRPNSPMSGEG